MGDGVPEKKTSTRAAGPLFLIPSSAKKNAAVVKAGVRGRK